MAVLALVAAVALMPPLALRAETAASASQDGLAASLSVEGEEAVLRWRFLRGGTQPLDSVAIRLNGVPLQGPRLEAPAEAADPPPVLVLLDVSNPARAAEARQDRMRVVRFWERVRGGARSLGLAAYADGPARLLPRGDAATVLAALVGQPAEPDLRRAIESAIPLMPESRWRRRGLYVFTDGRSAASLDVEALTRTAAATGTAITVVAPGARPADRDALGRLAAASGGYLIADEAAFAALLQEPFGLLDTGAMLRYPLKLGPRYPWEAKTRLEAVFAYADRQLILPLSPDMREAGGFESVGVLLDEASGVIALLLLLIGLGAAGFLVLRWRRRRPLPATGPATRGPVAARPAATPASASAATGAPAPKPAVAADAGALENLSDGTVYPLGADAVRIGRGRDNDIRLTDDTVSRAHARLVRDGGGLYRVENLSQTNPVLLNQASCEDAPLNDGDVLSVGATKLRFRCAS